jgi:lipoprotein-anchoring transpeptidase ErfK/SrfK
VSRPHRRVSRPLITLLISIVSVGILCVEYRQKQHTNAAPAAPSNPPAEVIELTAPATQPSPLDLSSLQPTNLPAAMVVTPVALPTTEPSTRPAAGPAILASASAPASELDDTSHLLNDAETKIGAGNLLDARNQLNQSLQSGKLDETQAAKAKAMLSQISQIVVFGHQRFPEDEYGGSYVVHSGDSLAKIALAHDVTWTFLGRINGIDPKHLRAGATIKVLQGPFFAVVDKRKFTMDIYLGGLPGEKSSMYVTSYQVGLGRDDSTPTGTWTIEPHHKLKHPTYYSPRGEGVIAADDPKNPLGGYWIGLTGTEGRAVGQLSYGIHGTIEPDSIGKQSSMGCIRLRADDIAVVFDLMVEGKSMVMVKE